MSSTYVKILKDRYKVTLYAADDNEVKLIEDRLYIADVDALYELHLSRIDNQLRRMFSLYLYKYISTLFSVLSNFNVEIVLDIRM